MRLRGYLVFHFFLEGVPRPKRSESKNGKSTAKGEHVSLSMASLETLPDPEANFVRTLRALMATANRQLLDDQKAVYLTKVFQYINDHVDDLVAWGYDRFMVGVETKCHEMFTDPVHMPYRNLMEITTALYTRLAAHRTAKEALQRGEHMEGHGEVRIWMGA